MAKKTRPPREPAPARTAHRGGLPSPPQRRSDLPLVMPGATRFSDDRASLNAHWAPQVLQHETRLSDAWDALRDGTTGLAPTWGRRRDPGFYALAFLNFTDSGQVDIEPWWTRTTDADWSAWNFAHRPGYNTVYQRFTELEEHGLDAFRATAREAIRYVDAKSGGAVGRDIHSDACEDQCHAQLQHDCRPGEKCPYETKRKRRRPEKPETAQEKRNRLRREERQRTRRVANSSTNEEAAEQRQTDNDSDPVGDDELMVGNAEEAQVDPDTGGIRLRVGEHWWRLLDETAGARAYQKGKKVKFWVGHLNVKSICHTFGAPVAVLTRSASEAEHNIYPDLLDEVKYMTGRAPLRSIGDKGLSVRKVFELNTEQGIGSVYPFRRAGRELKRKDTELHDRYGRPFCKHCGHDTRFVRFSDAGDRAARMWVRCTTCDKEFTVQCKANYRYLLPLWRDTEAYLSLRNAHNEYERVHDFWRDRYGIGAASVSMRPKRKGKDWKQLRCYAALIIEWLKIAHRYGYLNGGRRSKTAGEPYQRKAEAQVHRFRAYMRNLYMHPPRRAVTKDMSARADVIRRRRAARVTRPEEGPPGAGPPG
jgi:hypothetical protein